MIPRACDDDRCDYDDGGRWQHHPHCAAVANAIPAAWLDDMAAATAMEDGYAQPARIPAQQNRRAAA